MIKRIFFILSIISSVISCSDDDSFTTNPSALLTFSVDTLQTDTVFSTIGSRTYDFWVYNHSGDGLRMTSARLEKGNQTGFRVNVDGTYLDNTLGSVATNLEVRNGDSIRVFVEFTPTENGSLEPQEVLDRLIFKLESGTEQRVVLQGYSWDAVIMRNTVIHHDSVIECSRPVIVYGGLQVDSGATLSIRHSNLYFHDGKGIDVYGRLLTDQVTLRGDRLDRMFDYLPYDRVSGQWGGEGGIVFHASSTGNYLRNTEIRNAGKFGILCDSSAYAVDSYRLVMEGCVVHNTKGTNLLVANSNVRLYQCLFSNAQGDCVTVNGGSVDINRCTLAQFYPFVGGRGAALRFSNHHPLYALHCDSSIITGYEADVVMGVNVDTLHAFSYRFSHSLLRTPRVETADSVYFHQIIWESPSDSVQGKKHFKLVDETNLKYDFRLDSLSSAQGLGCF